MNNLFTHLKKEAGRIRLTSAERELMRAAILEAQSLRPAHAKPIPSPYRRFLVPRLLALYSFIGIIAIGSGTVSAAQGALPGDILYPIKVNIAEPVEAALAASPRGKAEVNARFAERRIQEIETLVERGTLDEATAEQVARNFDYYADQVEKHAKESSREDDQAFVAEVADSLTAIADSLAEADDSNDAAETFRATALPQTTELRSDERSGSEQSKSERTRKNSKDFADHVRARAWSMKHSGSDDDRNDDGDRGGRSGGDSGSRNGSGGSGSGGSTSGSGGIDDGENGSGGGSTSDDRISDDGGSSGNTNENSGSGNTDTNGSGENDSSSGNGDVSTSGSRGDTSNSGSGNSGDDDRDDDSSGGRDSGDDSDDHDDD